MLRIDRLLRTRLLAAIIAWVPLLLDAADAGSGLMALPAAGLLLGLLPVTWFPAAGPAQLGLAAATLHLAPRLTVSGGWLSSMAFGLALLLNGALWVRARAGRRAAAQV